MRSIWKKLAAAGLAATMGVSLLAGCGSKTPEIDGTKTAVTINDEAVSLGAVSFQSRYQQAYMYQLYSMYFGQTEIFDNVVDESTEKTYGDQIKESVLENIEEMVLLKQHAADYDVELSDEKKAEIEKIAQAYIDENSEEVRKQIGASKEDVIYLLELQTIQDMMREPMAKDVDTEVSDEEAQQTTVTYISILKKTEEDVEADESLSDESLADASVAEESVADTSLSDESAADESKKDDSVADESKKDDSVADESEEDDSAEDESKKDDSAEDESKEDESEKDTSTTDESLSDASTADESVADAAVSAAVEAANAELKEKAEKIISDIKATGNTADADMDEIAKAVDDSLSASTGKFTTNDPTETTLDSAIVEAVADLKDGELYGEVIETDTEYFIARVDKVFAEDETEEKKEEIVQSRKEDAYKKLVEEWKEAATITVDDKVMAELLITDSAPYTLKDDESVADESVADESLADVTTADSAAAELADSSVSDSSVSDESVADESVSDDSSKDESK